MRKSVYSDESAILAQTLKTARNEAGMHQADLAARMGKDQSIISNIERGQRSVDVIEFYDLATALGLEPVELYAKLVAQWRGAE